MTEAAAPKRARPEPIMELDLGGNGGLLAPSDLAELQRWIDTEVQFWAWLPLRNFGQASAAAIEAYSYLDEAQSHVDAAISKSGSQTSEWIASQLETVKAHLTSAFISRRLPHSSTPIGKRVHAFMKGAGDEAASYYLLPFLDNLNQLQAHSYAPSTLQGWHGAVAGQIDRHNLMRTLEKGRADAAEQAVEHLRQKTEALLGEKGRAIEQLHRAYEVTEDLAGTLITRHEGAFDEAQAGRHAAFEELQTEHTTSMETIRQTFIDGMAMRAPATYWTTKRSQHAAAKAMFAWITFLGIAAALLALCGAVGLMLHDLPATAAHPPAWQIAVLALGGLLVIWALRLIVRMYLSHIHLERDADERVVMVQTYLALLEAKALDSNEHRQLILNALFRPASDGIVKDEALPFSVAEVLTRSGKS
ncbi:hypothetical protein SAMN05216359_11726 [Roseateles sp. YR242]|uniref:DUF6161 domain-containing protein n=1 Tax=Roseateles sp. YR242 TaxID=1855305 RepID=UPI0008D1F0CD|nr:DUF6161 domain-containing protein [Roseateles sp. YR242]SEL79108.1 hypothetical protein SAMN05216359_11726 [Roseateles sp. YR242]